MATRFVFKLFASIGPAGALVGLTEKICTALYPHAYDLGDESHTETKVDKDIKKVREDYINQLFNMRNKFIKAQEAGDEAALNEMYKTLVQIIKKNIMHMTRITKNKYMRERLYYQRENKIVLYEEANSKYHKCEDEIQDNFIKQAKTILKPNETKFKHFLDQENLDVFDKDEVAD